jgi:predicted enzyme related to lactoylglutathione lyase
VNVTDRVNVDVLFAGVAVSDLETAVSWYDRLFGAPADIVVNDDEVMWHIASEAWLYVVKNRERAGRALVALAVADLEVATQQIADRGIPRPPIEVVGTGARKATFTDPDGNTVSFIEVQSRPD